jgi:hemerythrin-like domain-containing protein
MTDVMQSLYQDHANLAEITDIARQELKSLEAGEHAEYGLLEDIMRYVTGFPDTHHHPTEDVVFARLKMRVPGVAKDVDRMLTEHAALLTRSRAFLETVQAVEEGTVMRRDEFVRRGRDYLDSLAEHMRVEETRLFPLVEKQLSEADWAEVGRRVKQTADPIFGESMDEDYRQLRQRIKAQRRAQADLPD